MRDIPLPQMAQADLFLIKEFSININAVRLQTGTPEFPGHQADFAADVENSRAWLGVVMHYGIINDIVDLFHFA